jgi:NNP family nitrate/nitrite transporter-like MFS transporter
MQSPPTYQDSRQSYINLALATIAFAVAFTAWSLISPVAKQLQLFLNLDDFQKSMLIAMPVILGSLLRIPLGLLTDRFGGRKVFTALLALTLLPVAFLGTADSFWTYVLGGLFLGIAGCAGGLGGFFPPLVLGFVKGAIGTYVLGFVLLTVFALLCLVVLFVINRPRPTSTAPVTQ